jgi:hypothetical protein
VVAGKASRPAPVLTGREPRETDPGGCQNSRVATAENLGGQLPLDRSNSLADLAARIRSYHEATVAALKASVQHAMNAGDLLIEAKAQLKHGQWLPWLDENCAMSQRTAQLYIKLAKHRDVIEKAAANPQHPVTDLTLNEAAALCVLTGHLERLMEFTKRAEGCNSEQLVDLCIAEGIPIIKNEGYDAFHGRSEAEIREWLLFGFWLGRGSSGAFDHVEWILQRPFQNVDEWLGPEGSKFRKPYGWRDPTSQAHEAWAQFKSEYADKTSEDIQAEIAKLNDKPVPLVVCAAAYRGPNAS